MNRMFLGQWNAWKILSIPIQIENSFEETTCWLHSLQLMPSKIDGWFSLFLVHSKDTITYGCASCLVYSLKPLKHGRGLGQTWKNVLKPSHVQILSKPFKTFLPPWIVLASNLLKPFFNLFSKPFQLENLMKTPWLCWNHLKTFLASFMLLHFLIKTFWCWTWKLFHLMCRTFPPFQSHLTKELSKISLTQLCWKLLQEKTSKLEVKFKNAPKLMYVQLSPCFLPLCPIFIMSSTLHHVFSATMGYLPWLFPILQKTFIIHPVLVTYFEISNNPILEVNLFIIPLSHLNQNVMWSAILFYE